MNIFTVDELTPNISLNCHHDLDNSSLLPADPAYHRQPETVLPPDECRSTKEIAFATINGEGAMLFGTCLFSGVRDANVTLQSHSSYRKG